MKIHTGTVECAVSTLGYALLDAGIINTHKYSLRTKGWNERFELLTAVLLETQVCWHVTQ
jgi:hypothetical protein